MGRTGGLAGTALAVLALLADPRPAGAQCDPLTEQAAFNLTIDMEEQVYQLDKIRRQIAEEHDILMFYPGGVGLVAADAAAGLFSHAVLLGEMHPDEVTSQVRAMRQATNYYLHDFIEPDLATARACLEKLKRGLQPPPPVLPSASASGISWPLPMAWSGVKGVVRGSYVAECLGYRDYPAFRSAGTWRLELMGDGRVEGVFGDDARQYTVTEGTIHADGSASGLARSTNGEVPHLSWTTQVQRSGDNLLISSHKLDLMAAQTGPFSLLVECKPGHMRQE
jgi:hypothetical protein